MRHALPVLLLTLATSLGSGASHAQERGGEPPGRPPGERSGRGMSNPMLDGMAEQMQRAESQLVRTPEQGRLWRAYQDKVSQLIQDQLRPRPEIPGTALQKIEQKVDVVRNRLTAMEDIADAARRFYHSLDPQQQARADPLLPATLPPLYSGLISNGPGGPGGNEDGPPNQDAGGRRRR